MFVDEAVARRIERAEGLGSSTFVDARGGTSTWREIDDVFALYDGPTSELTQTFGFGLASPAAEPTLDAARHGFVDEHASVRIIFAAGRPAA